VRNDDFALLIAGEVEADSGLLMRNDVIDDCALLIAGEVLVDSDLLWRKDEIDC
jgi:hypothetical protein